MKRFLRKLRILIKLGLRRKSFDDPYDKWDNDIRKRPGYL